MSCNLSESGSEASKYFANIDNVTLCCTVIALCSCGAVCLLFALQWFYISKWISCNRRANCLKYLASIYPVIAVFSSLAVSIPRSAELMKCLIIMYCSGLFVAFVNLGRSVLSNGSPVLRNHLIQQIYLRKVLPCWRSDTAIKPTKKTFNILWYMALQAGVLRPAMAFMGLLRSLNGSGPIVPMFIIGQVLHGVSTGTAIAACGIYAQFTQRNFAGFRLSSLFRLLLFVIPLTEMQLLLMFLLSKLNGIWCDQVLSAEARALIWYHHLLIPEMLLLSGIASVVQFPRKTLLFDQHPFHKWRRNKGPVSLAVTTVF